MKELSYTLVRGASQSAFDRMTEVLDSSAVPKGCRDPSMLPRERWRLVLRLRRGEQHDAVTRTAREIATYVKTTRWEAVYSRKELDAFQLLRFWSKRGAIEGPAHRGGEYDRSDACRVCGAGAELLAPVPIAARSMGKSNLRFTAHSFDVVVTEKLKRSFVGEGLTGAEFLEVKSRKGGLYVMRPSVTAPVLAPHPTLARSDMKCPVCDRSAWRYDERTEPMHIGMSSSVALDVDLSWSWEYLGPVSPLRVGGGRAYFASQRLRAFFEAHKCAVDFYPVHLT